MANSLKQLMGMSESELIGLGAQYGLTFHTGMRKRDMAQQLQGSAASGWMETNSQLMSESPDEEYDSTVGFGGDSNMLSDSAHVAQIISNAGMGTTFKHVMSSGSGADLASVENYLNRLGANPQDVWMHVQSNPHDVLLETNQLKSYMQNNLLGNQEIMPPLKGHYSGDILGEYSTQHGGIQASYEHLAHMYIDKSAYNHELTYERDVSSVASRLAVHMGSTIPEVARAAAGGVHTSYIDALPRIGDPSIVGGVNYPREPLNILGLPMGSAYANAKVGQESEYSLTASLTGMPGWNPSSKALYEDVRSSLRGIADVYNGYAGLTDVQRRNISYESRVERGIYSRSHETSDYDRIMDTATRHLDIEDARERYQELPHDVGMAPEYNRANIASILGIGVKESPEPRRSYGPDEYSPMGMWSMGLSELPSSRRFTSDFGTPTDYNGARARRESKAIADYDSIDFRDVADGGGSSNPVQYHNALEQGSQEWLDFRKQYSITGSSVGGLLGNNASTRPWAEMIDRIGLKRGDGSINNFTQRMFDEGHRTEEVARGRVAQQFGLDISQTGAITNANYPDFMYSPDGLIGDDALWEHKNPQRAGKFSDLLAGEHADYMDQVQFGMHVSGRNRTLFSQTIGQETRSQWIPKDEGWYDSNKNRLDSILGRLDAGRAFVANNSGLAQEDLISGARRAMTGEGIWKDVSQRSNRGYSPTAGTANDPFARSSFSESGGEGDYTPNFTFYRGQPIPELLGLGHNPSVGGGESVNLGSDRQLAEAVKGGILAAQEENRNRGSTQDTFDGEFRRTDDADFADPAGAGEYSPRGGGRGGGGRRPPNNGGSFYDDFGRAGGALAAGVAGGSLSSMSSGAMQALMATPYGRIAGVAIGAVQIGNEAVEGMNDFYGRSLDAGVDNPNEYSSQGQGMEMLGLNSQQAGRVNQTTHSAYNTLLNGDPSAAINIIRGSRGLITIGDIRSTGGDPVALARIMRDRGAERGWSQQRMAGAAQMAGLDGFARSNTRSDYEYDNAGEVVQTGRDSDYIGATTELSMAQGERARVLPGYNVPQAVISNGEGFFSAAESATRNVRMGATGVGNAGRSIYDFIAGQESGGNPLARSSSSSAFGSMQTLDGTRRDPGFGVTPARDDSPEEAARVGRDYYDAMRKRYGNDDMAMAAYTDGPGTVDAAIKHHGNDWLNSMPAQAKNRVAAFHKWQEAGTNMQEGATGFTRNGASYGQTQAPAVSVNIQVNNKQVGSTVTATGGQTISQTVNMNNGAQQKR